jgi:hypothetical protein
MYLFARAKKAGGTISSMKLFFVMPAKAGIQDFHVGNRPACSLRWTLVFTGVTPLINNAETVGCDMYLNALAAEFPS